MLEIIHSNGGPPVGSICAFAGQVQPASSDPNQAWSAPCAASGAGGAPGLAPGQPVVLVEAQAWMLCDGRALEVAKYPRLFGVLGYLYGDAGAGTFRIPDCRGLFLRGVDNGAGMDPDAAERAAPPNGTAGGVGSMQCDALQTHTHKYGSAQTATPAQQGNSGSTPPVNQVETLAPTSPPARISQAETRPRNIAVNYLIRYR